MERVRIRGCIREAVFKYYFANTYTAKEVWLMLAGRFGESCDNDFFRVKQITSNNFQFRTTYDYGSLTLIFNGPMTDVKLEEIHNAIKQRVEDGCGKK
jgi:hypothetical protein